MPYGIAHLSVRTVTFGQKSNPNFNVGSIQAEAGYPYLSENFRALASDQEKNYSLAFSYVELTLSGIAPGSLPMWMYLSVSSSAFLVMT